MQHPVTGHTLKKFDQELSTLHDLVVRMGGLVEDQLKQAVDALQRCDAEAARVIIKRDREVDAIELRADGEIAHLLALHTPLGVDLRMVLTLSKSVNDLERVGDEAKKIARCCEQSIESRAALPRLPFMRAVSDMAQLAAAQLNGALDALVRMDVERAEAVKRADGQLDDAFDATHDAIVQHIAADPASAALSIQVLFAAKGLERVGDHAKNIAQYVFYLVEGRDVRHPKSNPARGATGSG